VAAPRGGATTPPWSVKGLGRRRLEPSSVFRLKEIRMSALLLTSLLAFGAADQPDVGKLEGKWTVVYAEEGGRPNRAWETRPAMFKDGTLSYEEDGKKQNLELKFGTHNTVTAKGLGKDGDKEAKGVYIMSQDYVTIALNPEGKSPAAGSSGDFVLILRRQRK
jgi:uncharacterized protein (TIGR03067 family)